MNAQEALEIIKNELPFTSGVIEEALDLVENCVSKQIPIKPKLDNDNGICETEYCPVCSRKLFPNEHHCKCGQALDWSRSEDRR